MRFPKVDDYIACFKDLLWIAGYNQNDWNTIYMFVKGLPADIMHEAFMPLIPVTYEEIKEKAIMITWSKMIISNILHSCNLPLGNTEINRNPNPGHNNQWQPC